jgi:hypothetical protein
MTVVGLLTVGLHATNPSDLGRKVRGLSNHVG